MVLEDVAIDFFPDISLLSRFHLRKQNYAASPTAGLHTHPALSNTFWSETTGSREAVSLACGLMFNEVRF